jgi:ABC-type dipeptide/oligopeptide/nickel transport system ATPase subunit
VNSQTTNAITALDASLQQSVTATLEENKKPKRYTKIFNGMKSSITNRRGDKKTDEDNGSI